MVGRDERVDIFGLLRFWQSPLCGLADVCNPQSQGKELEPRTGCHAEWHRSDLALCRNSILKRFYCLFTYKASNSFFFFLNIWLQGIKSHLDILKQIHRLFELQGTYLQNEKQFSVARALCSLPCLQRIGGAGIPSNWKIMKRLS